MPDSQEITAQIHLDKKAKDLLQCANENRKSGLFNDINIQVGNECFPCNKMVLSCYSTYFQTMFRTEMQERYQDTVELQGFDGKYIKMLIDYMYGEAIVIDDENVVQLLAAADYLQLQDVKDLCIEYFKTDLTIANCLDALKTHVLFKPKLPPDHIYLFISENFDAVSQQEKFRELENNEITTLLENLNKSQICHESIYNAIINWVEHSQDNRKGEFSSLFDFVDLTKVSSVFFNDVVLNNSLFTESEHCFCLIKTLTTKMQQSASQRHNCSAILRVGGLQKSPSAVEVYNVNGQANTNYPPLPTTTSLAFHCVETVDSAVFCIGGHTTTATANVYRMDLKARELTWSEVEHMAEPRCYHAAAIVKNNVIVAGGFVGKNLTTTEMYDVNRNKWMRLSSMNTGRSGHALVACKGCLYAVGGFCNDGNANTEKLNELEGEWKIAQPLNTPRNRLAAVCVDGVIYAMGGNKQELAGNDVQKSAEKYLPAENKWFYISDMNTERWGHVACVLRGRIFVIGGQDQNGNYVRTIECYDPVTDTWSIVQENVSELDGHGVVAV